MANQLVHNLTDVPTPSLRQAGLVSTHIMVEGVVIPPGGSALLSITPALLADTSIRRTMGALCIGEPPEKYSTKKAALAQQAEDRPAPVVEEEPKVEEEPVMPNFESQESPGPETRRFRRRKKAEGNEEVDE